MPDTGHTGVRVVSALLILCLLMVSGCTSIPGPEPRTNPTPVKTTIPVTPQVKNTVTKEKIVQPSAVTPLTPVPPATYPKGTYESLTCARQGGGIVKPGQQCRGAWLSAVDTFSCCSSPPVSNISRNASTVIEPFDLVIATDDDPGSILP